MMHSTKNTACPGPPHASPMWNQLHSRALCDGANPNIARGKCIARGNTRPRAGWTGRPCCNANAWVASSSSSLKSTPGAQPDDHQQSQWLPRLECLPYHQQRQQQQQEELQQQQKPLGQQPAEQKQPQQEQNVASGTSHAPLPPPPPPTLPSPPVRQCSVDDWRSPLSCDGGFAPKQLATLTQSPLADVADSCGTPEVEVALGKFDALHLGHRSLAIQAAKHGAYPLLLSFWGMAQVLGWPPRLPLVAPPDRPRVLASWQGVCGGRAPRQRLVPFREIRGLSPAQFVELLAHDLGVAGVVAGSNYRFGFRAQGDAGQLRLLGEQHGLRVSIMQLLHADSCTTHSPQHTGAHGGQQRRGRRGSGRGRRLDCHPGLPLMPLAVAVAVAVAAQPPPRSPPLRFVSSWLRVT
ncbi:hypothetical protein V8C86DRAFT_486651 [Haematococcus lacustris]